MTLTRRDTTKLVLASPLLLTPTVMHAASDQDWAKRLRADLNTAIKPDCDGTFNVVKFARDTLSNGDILFKTVVELRWPPGRRRKLFQAYQKTDIGAYYLLVATVLSPYRKAWTYPDGTSCIA